jgi:pimeloyl-ACP methyl ester carboxylesterase
MPTVNVKGNQLAFTEIGQRDGPPVILLHAFPLRGALWAAQADALSAAHGCRVILPDLRGFGASDVPAGPYAMEVMAQDALGLADALGIGRFALGGISMGGYIAFALLRQAAQRVSALILADTKATADTAGARQNRETLAQAAEREGLDAVADQMLPSLLSPAGVNQPDLAGAVRAMILGNQPAGIAAAARGMAMRPDATELLPLITVPTLIIVGELDLTAPIHDARLMFERIPNARLEVLRDAGHLSNLEAPVDFNLALTQFMAA